MRFLIDECLSPEVGEVLIEHGHDVVHVRDLGMQQATDREVLDRARDERRILVSADTDFGAVLAQLGAAQPSVVVFRRALAADRVNRRHSCSRISPTSPNLSTREASSCWRRPVFASVAFPLSDDA
jgi:predicted nuclease of predicted toxin-antitoxin system